jgi:hypothetical protein
VGGKAGRKGETRKTKTSIKIDLGEIRWGCMDCIDLAQHRDQLMALEEL